jgi:threonine/homoserine/homoserine lactone efflux protein
MLELSVVFMAVTFVVFVLYGAFAAAVRSHVIAPPRRRDGAPQAFGGAFVALAAAWPSRTARPAGGGRREPML